MPIITKPATIEKAQSASFTLDKSALAAVTSVLADLYFSDSVNWKEVLIYYQSTIDGQKEILKFDAALASPTTNFLVSDKARDIFKVKKIIIRDFDGGYFQVIRSELTAAEFDPDYDVDMTPGAAYLWQHIFTPVNNATLSGFALSGTGQELPDGVSLVYNQSTSASGSVEFNTLFPEMPINSSASFTVRVYMEVLSGSFQDDVRIDILNPYGGASHPIGGHWGSTLSGGFSEILMPAMGRFGSYKDLTISALSWNGSYSVKIIVLLTL